MTFHDYVGYRTMSLTKIARETNISVHRLKHPRCPINLTEEEIVILVDRMGDWRTFTPQYLKIKEETDK